MKVNLENNKYTLTFDEANGSLVANRNGEYWMDYSGNKFVYLMLARIVELESVLKEYANPDNWGDNTMTALLVGCGENLIVIHPRLITVLN